MPKGEGFVDYSEFRAAYEVLKSGSDNFRDLSEATALAAIEDSPLAFVVLRTILGLSPPEFAYVASARTGITIDQSVARRVDKRAREGRSLIGGVRTETLTAVKALVRAAVIIATEGAPSVPDTLIHRIDKADTSRGLESIKRVSEEGAPYEVLLYERLLGRPFATHRDAVSEKVGESIEEALRTIMQANRIPFHEAGVAERFEDMDQAPDFLIPNAETPRVVIEAKLAEDDGTARDKATRVQHLAELRDERTRRNAPSFDVIACVDGRGFGIRRRDVKKLLIATRGKLFTLRTVDRIVDATRLNEFRSG